MAKEETTRYLSTVVKNLAASVDVEGLKVKTKFYTSLCCGTTAILSVFAFLFLIPFVVDPAISTILADYESKPVTCVAVEHIYAEGLSNCSWSSCREGCTNAPLRCHQIFVNYTKLPFEEWQKGGVDLESLEWDVGETKFYINTEGCGYPPRVNCSEFAKKYGFNNLGKPFPCYYSKTYPDMVVARYSWDDNLKYLVLSLVIPNVLFAISIGILIYWYCPGCNKSRTPLDTSSYVESFHSKNEGCLEYSLDDEDDEDVDGMNKAVLCRQNGGPNLGFVFDEDDEDEEEYDDESEY